MTKKILSPSDTWTDFWGWIKEQDSWQNLSREERQYLDKTNRHIQAGKVGLERLTNALNKYAPDRYEFKGGFILHDEKIPE